MDKLKDLNEIKHNMIDWVKTETTKGLNGPEEIAILGEVVDMIKDLASAEESCMEACYYETITEAMTEADGEGRMGYDRWRYSSGRFAPKGRGSRTYGYLPSGDRMAPEMLDARTPVHYDRMGYTEGKETVEEIIDTMGDMWAKADDNMKKKMKTHVQDLLYQMNQEEL